MEQPQQNPSFLPNWPYLTADIPPLDAKFKLRADDFIVEEIPAYQPVGQGDHIYFIIEKTGLTTLELLRKIARKLNIKERNIGYAGLKDSLAVTRQMMSIEHIEPEKIQNLDIPNTKILWVGRHKNKLKLGHLAGNKFCIKLRDLPPDAKTITEKVLSVLEKRGVPNYFGHQRFGVRGDSWLLGRALIHSDFKEFLDQFLGRPTPTERDHIKKARQLYDEGQYELAYHIWPGYFRDAKKACKILAANPNAHKRAVDAIDIKLKKLFISAYQSYLFNQTLAQRIESIDKLYPGDLARREDTGGVFLVEDVSTEQPRADRFAISPTGPLFGYRMKSPEGFEADLENKILESENLTLNDFRKAGNHKVKGSRRSFRVKMSNIDIRMGSDDFGEYLLMQFDLPSGSYATAVLRELLKSENNTCSVSQE